MLSSAFPKDLWEPLEVGRGLPTAIRLCPQAGDESQERVGSPSWLPFSKGPASLVAGLWCPHLLCRKPQITEPLLPAKATLNSVAYINKAQSQLSREGSPNLFFADHYFVFFLCYTVLLLWLSPLFSALGAWQAISPFIQSFTLSSSSSYPKVAVARQGEGGEDS